MKKSILLILALVICLSVLLVSCGEATEAGDTSQNNTESSLPPSSETNDSSQTTSNWYDNAVSLTPSAPDEPSQPDEPSVPDEPSQPDEPSIPDEPTQPNEEDKESYKADGMVFASEAKGYIIVYTKSSALNAVGCETNALSKVTAIYDGSVTRFFNSIDGTYYCAVYGKYHRTLDDLFISGEGYNDLVFLKLNFDENGVFVDYSTYTDGLPDHEEMNIYSQFDKMAYVYRPCCDSFLYEFKSGVAAICQYYESDYSLQEKWDADFDLAIDESKLGKWGVIKDGEIIIPFEYDRICSYQTETEKGVYYAEKDGRAYYISSTGVVLTPEGFTCGSQPFNNRAWVFDGENGYIIEFN